MNQSNKQLISMANRDFNVNLSGFLTEVPWFEKKNSHIAMV
jgi:hypothetical protein